jgi:hypothetical protein
VRISVPYLEKPPFKFFVTIRVLKVSTVNRGGENCMSDDLVSWLLNSDEPWTRYRTRIDLLGLPEDSPEVVGDRKAMLNHPWIKTLIKNCASWPGYPLKRHNDAKHLLHALAVLADFGLHSSDPGMSSVVKNVMAHQSDEGAFLTKVQLYKQFGGLEGEYWTWMACDAPVLLYILLSFGLGNNNDVQNARDHILSLVNENGWHCNSSPMLGNFKGPGKREDPCPIATVYALKALSLDTDLIDDPRISQGVEMLLQHWESRGKKKYYLFGIGTDFQKLKYPLIWYDLLHVLDVLSRFPFIQNDSRFLDMMNILMDQADEGGKYTATSMYRAWKEWSFADKKNPSPWLTFLVNRVCNRSGF